MYTAELHAPNLRFHAVLFASSTSRLRLKSEQPTVKLGRLFLYLHPHKVVDAARRILVYAIGDVYRVPVGQGGGPA